MIGRIEREIRVFGVVSMDVPTCLHGANHLSWRIR